MASRLSACCAPGAEVFCNVTKRHAKTETKFAESILASALASACTMPAAPVRSYTCKLPLMDYWRLRLDPDWYLYGARLDNNTYEILEEGESVDDDGEVVCTRAARVTAKINPVPESLRGFLGCDKFSFIMRERWWRDLADEAHPNTFSTEPPVMADRISVNGSAWAEAINEYSCRLHFQINVKVSVFGMGDKIAKTIAAGSNKAYDQVPNRAVDFFKKRAAEAPRTPVKERWGRARSHARKLVHIRLAFRRARPRRIFYRRKKPPIDRQSQAFAEAIRLMAIEDSKRLSGAEGSGLQRRSSWMPTMPRLTRSKAWPSLPVAAVGVAATDLSA